MAVLTHPDIRSFLDYLKFEKRYSAHTIISYQTDLAGFFDFLETRFGKMRLSEISHSFIRSWLADLKEKNFTSKSINRKISGLRSFFRYHLKTGAIDATPMSKVISPKTGKRLPVFVKEAETKALIKTLNEASEDWKTLNAKMLIILFYSTGMRLSELINLKEKQLDPARLQIKVLGKGNKERIIPISRELMKDIDEYRRLKRKEFDPNETPGGETGRSGEKTDNVLLVTEKGKKLYPKYAYLLVKQYLGQAGTLEKKSPHVLRHTFATHLMNSGADLNAVKELLGHSSLASTQIYTHNSIEKLRNVYKKAHPKA